MDYTTYLTSEHQVPNFQSIITGLTTPLNDLQSLNIDLDVNTATGSLLDTIGAWVGVSRILTQPLDVQLLWDTSGRTWDSLYSWVAEGTPISGITVLDDATYRNIIKFTIIKNHYDGTKQTALTAFSALSSSELIDFEDVGNMSINVILLGSILDTITISLITNGYLSFAPFGVNGGYLETSRDSSPMFAWGNNSEYFGGWDTSSWANIYNI